MRSSVALAAISALLVSGISIAAPPGASATTPTVAPSIHAATFAPASPNPILSWDAVSGAAKYRVQISDSTDFATLIYQVDTVGLQVTPDSNLPLTTLHWRVAAEDSTGHAGPYSASNLTQSQFATSWSRSPNAQYPSGTLHFPAQPADFRWQPLSGAKSYELQVDDTDTFVSPQYDVKTSSTSYVLPDPQTPNQPFYWRVRGISANSSVVSRWSSTLSYTYTWDDVPTNLLSTNAQASNPADSSTLPQLADVSLSWDPVAGAAKYEVQVSPNRDFTNNVTIDTTVEGAAYTPEPPLASQSYFWRVRAIDAATAPHNGGWSAVQAFTRTAIPAPSLIAPKSGSDPSALAQVQDTPTFRWTPVEHAAYYDLQVSTDASFASANVYDCTTNHTTFTPLLPATTLPETCTSGSPPMGLDKLVWQSGTTYYWRVRGIDAPSNLVGAWSSSSAGAFQFFRSITAPTYEQPANAATVAVPTLVWDPVDGAASYRVTVKNSSNSAVVNAVTTYATSFTPTTALPTGSYTWYVQSVDITGAVSGILINGAQSFTIGGSPPTGATPDPTSSVLAPSTHMPLLSWQAVSGATKYTVHYGANGVDLGTLTTTQPYSSFTPTSAPLPVGTYSWWVDAYNGSTYLSTSYAMSQFTVATLSPVDQGTMQTTYDSTDNNSTVSCGGSTICGDTPTFTWSPVAGASSYVVTVANDKDFTNIAHTYDTRYTTVTPRSSFLDSQAGDASYWFVTPCNGPLNQFVPTGCGTGPSSGAPSFKKRSRAVVLCARDNATAVTPTPNPASLCPLSAVAPNPYRQVTFSWVDYLDQNSTTTDSTGSAAEPATQEAKQYRLQVSNVADFSTLLATVVVDGTSYTPTLHTYPVGPLYWRVQAIDNSDNPLTWSAPQLIQRTLQAPQQNITSDFNSSDTSSTVTGAPLLTWQPSPFAAKYNVEIYPDTTFTPSAIIRAASGSSKFAAYTLPVTATLAPGTYAWRVQAVDVDGNVGPWYTDSINTTDPQVDKRSFTFTIAAPAPSLDLPNDGLRMNSGNVLFTWEPVDQAAQYQWQLSPTQLFGSGTINQKTVMTAWSPLAAFADGTWYWRVQALDAAGNVLSTSPGLRALTKDATSPTMTQMSPTSSLAVGGAITATFSEPVTNVTSSAFVVAPATGGAATPGQVSSNGTTATWTPTKALIPGQTYTVQLTSGIVDGYGNPLVPASRTMRTATLVENDSPALVEQWDRDSASGALGGTYDASRDKGATATYQFTGSSVSVLGARMKSGGNAAVYLDGVLQSSTVSFYNAAVQYRKAVWSKSGLANGPHTVTVRVQGTKPGAATNTWVYLDGFQVGSTQVDQANAAVHEAFARASVTGASGGSYDSASHATSGDTGSRPSYSLSFRSTSVSVYGMKSPNAAKAAIYLDGKLKTTIDLRYTSTTYNSLITSLSGLSDQVHTIRIEPVGTATGARSLVGIDYLRLT